MPEFFRTLRGVIDQGWRKRKGRFLILGSASIDLLRQSGGTLAGRIACIELGPLSPFGSGTTVPHGSACGYAVVFRTAI